MSTCVPAGTDWSCMYTDQEIAEMRLDPKQAALIDRSEALAWDTLAGLCADQVAACPITVRPCAAGCGPVGAWMEAPVAGGSYAGWTGGGLFAPFVNSSGSWVNGCGCRAQDCSCTHLSEVLLPGPVGGIVSVYEDGVELDYRAYRVDDGVKLVRLDGGVWPACQDMEAGPEEVGGFSVTYYRGAAPDQLSLYVAGLLAAEYMKACRGDKGCRLPSGVTTVVRQGVTYQINTDWFSQGLTGIREVDAYISRRNPNHLRMAPVIAIPGLRKPRMTTWSHT